MQSWDSERDMSEELTASNIRFHRNLLKIRTSVR